MATTAKRSFGLIVVVVILCSSLVVLLWVGLARWLVPSDVPVPVDAVIVLAGDPNYERTATAVRVWRETGSRLLVLTGGEPGPGDSASSLAAQAAEAGVPATQMRLEQKSRTTHETFELLRPLLATEGVRSAMIVSSPYHQRRALASARKSLPGIKLLSIPASPSFWSPSRAWYRWDTAKPVLTEYIKLFYYRLQGWV